MSEAGIDNNIFKPHSIRGTTCAKAAGVRVTVKGILDVADWLFEGTFSIFIIGRRMAERPLDHQFCHHKDLQRLHVDMKRSLLKCNLRMAQGTRRLHAIYNYMRKVKLKYQHFPPFPFSQTYQCIHHGYFNIGL